MKKNQVKRERANDRIDLALYRMRKGYPHLYRETGARYIRFILKKVLEET